MGTGERSAVSERLEDTDRQVAPQTTLGWLRGSHQKRVVLRKGRGRPPKKGPF